MHQSSLFIPEKKYREIYNYFFSKRVRTEKVAFIFAEISKTDHNVKLEYKKWYPVKSNEYEYRSGLYVELKDEMRQKIIKTAFDLNTSIVELHSHLYSKSAGFTPSDFVGFEEFVPHVWWRLNGKPYVAIVLSESDFDALIWIDNPRDYQQLTEIIVGKQHLYPNGLSLKNLDRKYGYWSF